MIVVIALRSRRSPLAVLVAAATALVLLTASVSCSSLTVHPSPSNQTSSIAGNWQRDTAGSDDFEAKLALLLKERQQRLRARHGRAENGARNGDDADGRYRGRDPRDFDILQLPQEATEQFRRRMVDDLRPAQLLHITSQGNGEAIDVAYDAETAGRRYLPGQRVSRIDDSGAAQINCGWENQAFVVHAEYVHHATRSWRYEVEPATGMLLLRFEVTDPEIGRLSLTSRYRRQSL
jgi:hypothetical protein